MTPALTECKFTIIIEFATAAWQQTAMCLSCVSGDFRMHLSSSPASRLQLFLHNSQPLQVSNSFGSRTMQKDTGRPSSSSSFQQASAEAMLSTQDHEILSQEVESLKLQISALDLAHSKDLGNIGGNRRQWPRWRLQLLTKLRRRSTIYPTEWDKIEYARDHCTGDAFDIIGTRADADFKDPYPTLKALLDDLGLAFGDSDDVRILKAFSKMESPDMEM